MSISGSYRLGDGTHEHPRLEEDDDDDDGNDDDDAFLSHLLVYLKPSESQSPSIFLMLLGHVGTVPIYDL